MELGLIKKSKTQIIFDKDKFVHFQAPNMSLKDPDSTIQSEDLE